MPVGDLPPNTPTPTGQRGWECPKCGATYAPWVASCSECKPPEQGLRQRIQEARPPAVLPVAPYAPPVYPAPLFPAPQWSYQDRIVWCGPATVAPADCARLTMGAGAGVNSTYTITLTSGPEPDQGDDDGTAGVPART